MATEILQHKTQTGKKAGKKWTEHQLAVGQIPATWGMCDEVTKEDEERQEMFEETTAKKNSKFNKNYKLSDQRNVMKLKEKTHDENHAKHNIIQCH